MRTKDAVRDKFPLEFFEFYFGTDMTEEFILSYRYTFLPSAVTAATTAVGKLPLDMIGYGNGATGHIWQYHITSTTDLTKTEDPVDGFQIRPMTDMAGSVATYSNGILTVPLRVDPYQVQGTGRYRMIVNTNCDCDCGAFDSDCKCPKYCQPLTLEDISDPPQYLQKLHCKG